MKHYSKIGNFWTIEHLEIDGMAFKRVHPLVYISFTCSFVTHNKQETFVKHVSPHHLDIIGCTGICYGQ